MYTRVSVILYIIAQFIAKNSTHPGICIGLGYDNLTGSIGIILINSYQTRVDDFKTEGWAASGKF